MQAWLILLFVLLFGVLAYRRWSPILLGPTVSFILCLVAGLPVLSTMLGPYLTSTTNFIKNNFFVFFLGAIFGAIMEKTGGARSIAVWMSKVTKNKFTLPLIMTIAGLLCYGGVVGFVVYFAIYPIALHLCKESNTSRALIPGTIGAGCWTFANCLPGSPSVPNVTASKYLSTPPTADLVAGIIWGGIVLYVLNFLYLEWQARKYTAAGKGFVSDDVVMAEMDSIKGDAKLPHPLLALIPMILILVLFNILKFAIEWALLAGVISAIILMFKYGGKLSDWLVTCNKGAANTAGVILNVSLVVGFAGVMQQTTMFKALVENIGNIGASPLVFVGITTAASAAAAASSAGGMGVAMEAFSGTYLSMATGNPVIVGMMHRVAVIAASTLDTLPHTGGQITLLQICHQTHKDSFKHIFITQAVIPIIGLVCLIAWHAIGL